MLYAFMMTLIVSLGIALAFTIKRISYLIGVQEAIDVQVNESLDILNVCYSRLNTASQTPVFSDEPVIKGVMSDIQLSRDAVLLVANKIVNHASDEDGTDD